MNSHRISGQAIDDQNPSEENIEVQEAEDVVTPGGVASGSAAIDQRVKDSVEDFWRFHSKWIDDAVQEVRFSLLSDNL